MRRLHTGEWLALIAALALFGVLFGRWFGVDVGGGWTAYAPLKSGAGAPELHRSGWGALGWFMDLLLALLIFGGVLLAATTAVRRSPAIPVGVAAVTWSVGALIWFILLFVVLAQPGLGLDLGNANVTIEPLAYVGLVLAALIVAGAFLALKDERTGAPESAYEPPPARPIPDV